MRHVGGVEAGAPEANDPVEHRSPEFPVQPVDGVGLGAAEGFGGYGHGGLLTVPLSRGAESFTETAPRTTSSHNLG